MRLSFAGLCPLALLALLPALAASGARADEGVTYVRLSVTGACPEEAVLRTELQTLVRLVDAPRPDAWSLAVHGADGRTLLRLEGPPGQQRGTERGIERELPSRDCAALAGVIGRIVERHLSSLNLPVGGVEPAPNEAPAAEGTRSRPRVLRSAPGDAGAATAPRWTLRVFAGVGPRLEVGPSVVQATPQVGASLGVSEGVRAGLAVDVLTPWRLRRADEEADLVGAGLRAHGGYELTLAPDVRLVPFALLRVGLVWVSADDLPGAERQTRAFGELGVGAELSWEAHPGFELWAAGEARAPMNVARYRIEPEGQVGTSALAVLEATLGIAVRTNP